MIYRSKLYGNCIDVRVCVIAIDRIFKFIYVFFVSSNRTFCFYEYLIIVYWGLYITCEQV